MEKNKAKKVSTPRKLSTPKKAVKGKKASAKDTLIFRCASVISVALVFTAGQRIGELVYYLVS